MFANPIYLHIRDNESNDEKANENHSKKPWVVDMCGFMTSNYTSPNVEKEKDHNQPSNSSTPMEKTLVQMGDIMQEFINEVKEDEVQFIDHATSLLRVIAKYIQGIHLSKVNEVVHLGMVFH